MIKSFISFIRLILSQKHLIGIMVKREVATQYVGSFLGLMWTFIHPMVMIFVFWFVFSIGLRVRPSSEVPFVVWLTAGMSAWFVFSDIINSGLRSNFTSVLLSTSDNCSNLLIKSMVTIK